MKVLFLCLGNEFTPEMKYKENYFIQAAVENNDEVYVIANTKTYINGRSQNVSPGVYDETGYSVHRLKNMNLGLSVLSDKIRITPGLKKEILSIRPDVLFYNCPQIWNVNELKELRECLQNCIIVWDFSTWYGNSGKNWLSLHILHKGVYRKWLRKNEKYVSKIYYTADDPHMFIKEVYGLNENKMRLNDLPSNVISDEELCQKRVVFRKKEGIGDALIFVHTGKMGKQKRTLEILNSFNAICNDYDTYLYIIGSFEEEIKTPALDLINQNDKIRYVGFKKADDMLDIIAGCDIYLQPGSTSQTFQEAICRGCIPIFAEREYDANLVGKYGREIHERGDLENYMTYFLMNKDVLPEMRTNLLARVRRRLDYHELYQKMIDPNEVL